MQSYKKTYWFSYHMKIPNFYCPFSDNSWASSGRDADSAVHVPDKYGWCEHDDDQCDPAQDWGQHADWVSQGTTPPLSYSKCCVHACFPG